MRTDKVVFRLKSTWEAGYRNIYNEIRSGTKNIEYREAKPYWLNRLLRNSGIVTSARHLTDLTKYLKVKRAWFTVGMPKNNLPRLEADITRLTIDHTRNQLQIHIANVEEVTA